MCQHSKGKQEPADHANILHCLPEHCSILLQQPGPAAAVHHKPHHEDRDNRHPCAPVEDLVHLHQGEDPCDDQEGQANQADSCAG